MNEKNPENTAAARLPAPIVDLIGRPNAGKSTLFNRITKSRKAIVDPRPGVTRDRQYERVEWEKHSFILVDTGGLEISQGPGRTVFAGSPLKLKEFGVRVENV